MTNLQQLLIKYWPLIEQYAVITIFIIAVFIGFL